jgi:membrane protein YdbS with pleckstrin-like domain
MQEAPMKPTAFQVHKAWLIRAALVLVVTALIDAAAVWFMQRPIFWAALIGSSLPLSMIVFVAIPVLREERRKSEGENLGAK